ncbi:hypothetical protein NOS3756_37190 [Nostoc sp. NIES-3756]|uniref:hypothetical protein n=1 Tax=Nostoc sp. NIES-3756 TaxID=1751286 RepID=UPI0007206746|nr:hypothetical protein [Nostoc sp. NIES-3756]BAT54746.1 hypothetical protein NOS3756_37190 [Nostoc sp. NIES-3756]
MFNFGRDNVKSNTSRSASLLHGLRQAWLLIFLVIMAMFIRGGNLFGESPNVTNLTEIADNTDEFMGKAVTIKSEATAKIGQSSFTINNQKFLAGQPLVVINASGKPFDLPPNQNTPIQVTGEVRNLVIPEIEREYNLNIQDEYYKDYVNQPAIIARHLALAPQLTQINQSPEQYYGRQVVVTGKVANINSPVLLTLNEGQLFGEQDLVVLLKTPATVAINQGQGVSVVGEVRPFVVADIARDYNFTWDENVRRQLEVEYGNKTVLIADTVYPY